MSAWRRRSLLRVFGLALVLLSSCSPKQETAGDGVYLPGGADVVGLLAITGPDGTLLNPKTDTSVPRTRGPFFTPDDIETIEAAREAESVAVTIAFKPAAWERMRGDSKRFVDFGKTFVALARDGKMISEQDLKAPVGAELSFLLDEKGAMELLAGLPPGARPDAEARRFERVEWLKTWLMAHPEDIHALVSLAKGLGERGDAENALAAYEELFSRAEFTPDAPVGKAAVIEALGREYARAGAFERGIKFLRAAYEDIGAGLSSGKLPAEGAFDARSAARALVLRLYNGAGEADHALKLSTQFRAETEVEAVRYGVSGAVRDRALARLETAGAP